MADIENLSRDELLKMLQKISPPKKTSPKKTSTPTPKRTKKMCIYKPTRGKNPQPCSKDATTTYGFCSVHKNTGQARIAYSKKQKRKKSVTPTPTPTKKIEILPPQPKKVESEEEVYSSEEEVEVEVEEEQVEEEEVEEEEEEVEEEEVEVEEEEVEEEEEEVEEVVKVEKEVKTKKPKEEGMRLRRNDYGNFEHKETSIVFNPRTVKACGIQHPNGTVYPLSAKDIKVCERNQWDYEWIED